MRLKNIKFPSFKNSGESVTEVLIAIVILSSILVAVFSMLNESVGANQNVKNRIIALNIAREGIEAVRNLRDTNWLKYSGDRRGKWLCWDKNPTFLNACFSGSLDPEPMITGDKHYRIDFSIDKQRYYLEDMGPNVVLDLDAVQTDLADLRLYKIPKGEMFAGRYTHAKDDGGAPAVTYNSTPFFRQIEVVVENPYEESGSLPTFCDSDIEEPNCTKHRARVTARVQWKEDAISQSVTLESYLYDFYERDDY